jgi:hypothetical protein
MMQLINEGNIKAKQHVKETETAEATHDGRQKQKMRERKGRSKKGKQNS